MSELTDRMIRAFDAHKGVARPAIEQLMAEAWDEGHKQGGPMHDVNYDDPDAHNRNPYRESSRV